MSIKEIVHCYVSQSVSAPEDIDKLRASFVENGFREKLLGESKWLYKRGASVALEFNYRSEAIEMQVILEKIGDRLKISVGNWGFPFEPLLMKPRFLSNLSDFAAQIETAGQLSVNRAEVIDTLELAKRKGYAGKAILLAATFLALVWTLVGKT